MKLGILFKFRRLLFTVAALFLPFECRTRTLLTEVDAVRPTSVRSLLSEPGGLERAARQGKHIFVHIHNSQYQPLDLLRIYTRSSLIVIGKCVDRWTSWESKSNLVTTSYTIHVDDVLKGNLTKQPLVLTVHGGVIAFSDVAVAEVESTEYSSLTLGSERIFFLAEGSNGMSLVNGIEGLFSFDLSTGRILSMSAYDKYPHRLAIQEFGQLSSFVPMLAQLRQDAAK